MSQTTDIVSKAIELQQNAIERSQEAMEQAVEIPMQRRSSCSATPRNCS